MGWSPPPTSPQRYCDLLFQEVTREEEEFRRHQEEQVRCDRPQGSLVAADRGGPCTAALRQRDTLPAATQCREAEAILRQEQLHRCQSDQEILERHEHRVRNVAAHRIQWAFRRRRQLRAIVRIQRMFRRQRTCLRRRARRPMRAWPADTGRPAPPARASPARPASEHKRGGPAPAGSLHAARVPSIEELSNRIGTLGREELSRCSLPVLQQTLVAAQQRQHGARPPLRQPSCARAP